MKKTSNRGKQPSKQQKGTIFEQVMGQRKVNLSEETKKLRLAQKKLNADMDELEIERSRLAVHERQIEQLSKDLSTQDASSSYLQSPAAKKSELKQQTIMLHKTAADLKQQLAIAQRDLEETELRIKMNRKEDSGKAAQLIEQEFAEKQFRVQSLRELLDTLNNEILTRENEVIELELEAASRRKLIENVNEQKLQLMKRRAMAQMELQKIKKQIQERESTEQLINDKQSKVSTSFELADREHERIIIELDEIAAEEEKLRQEKEVFQKKKAEFERKRMLRMKEQQKQKEDFEAKYNAEEERRKLELMNMEEEDLMEAENVLEVQERQFDQELEEVEYTNQKEIKSCEERNNKIQHQIEEINSQIEALASEDNINEQIFDLQTENNASNLEMQEKKEEIENLKKQIIDELEMKKTASDLQSQVRAVAKSEKELNNESNIVKYEEEELVNDEDGVNQAREEVNAEKKMIVLKKEANLKLINIYQKQLESATERYNSLTDQIHNNTETH